MFLANSLSDLTPLVCRCFSPIFFQLVPLRGTCQPGVTPQTPCYKPWCPGRQELGDCSLSVEEMALVVLGFGLKLLNG